MAVYNVQLTIVVVFVPSFSFSSHVCVFVPFGGGYSISLDAQTRCFLRVD